MKNNFKKVLFVALILSSFIIAGNASASATIISAKLNGSSDLTANPNAQVTATINVNLTNSTVWRSTAYKIGTGNWNCVDTPDHSGNIVASETFLITAPREAGTNNVNFEIYENNNCTNGLDMASASASLLTAVTNVFSLGTGGIWISLLILIILAIIIFYIVKKVNGKKQIF
jgi:hypothetical protein